MECAVLESYRQWNFHRHGLTSIGSMGALILSDLALSFLTKGRLFLVLASARQIPDNIFELSPLKLVLVYDHGIEVDIWSYM